MMPQQPQDCFDFETLLLAQLLSCVTDCDSQANKRGSPLVLVVCVYTQEAPGCRTTR